MVLIGLYELNVFFFFHCPGKQGKTMKIMYLAVIVRTAKKLNLNIRNVFNENSFISAFHI